MSSPEGSVVDAVVEVGDVLRRSRSGVETPDGAFEVFRFGEKFLVVCWGVRTKFLLFGGRGRGTCEGYRRRWSASWWRKGRARQRVRRVNQEEADWEEDTSAPRRRPKRRRRRL